MSPSIPATIIKATAAAALLLWIGYTALTKSDVAACEPLAQDHEQCE